MAVVPMRAHVKKLMVVKRIFFGGVQIRKMGKGKGLRLIPYVWSTFKPAKVGLY
jgi:hypothetical protein